MRKEVKFGMAIGGGLIAVLVVYLLVAPPANTKKGAQFTDAGVGQNIIDNGQQSGGAAVDPAASDQQPQPDPAPAAASAKPASDAAAPVAHDTSKPAEHEAKAPITSDKPAAPNTAGGDPWTVLKNGKVPKPTAAPTEPKAKDATNSPKDRDPVQPTKPNRAAPRHDTVALGTPAPGEQTHLYYNPGEPWGGGLSSDAVIIAGKTGTTSTKSHASADASAGNTHVVQSGETLSAIAAAAYGSAAYYPHILRANPGINPNNLKLGTVLNLPHVDDVKAPSAAPANAAERTGVVASIVQDLPKIDATHQYRVQSGDSLYKISVKLYGKSSLVDQIYEKNKQAIGPDPKRLRLGMILELPEKTTVASTETPAANSGSGETPEPR